MNFRIGIHLQKRGISIDSLGDKQYFERYSWCFRRKISGLFTKHFDLSIMFRPLTNRKSGHREFSTSWFQVNMFRPTESKQFLGLIRYYAQLERSWYSKLWRNDF